MTATPIQNIVNACNSATTVASGTKGRNYFDANTGSGGGYSHIMTPNKKACFFSDAAASSYICNIDASSNHSGGVNVGMLDGSVKFIKDSINQVTWWALATKAGVTQSSGLLIVTIEPNSPADKAGLLIGDLIIGVAGQPVTDVESLRNSLTPDKLDQAVQIKLLRGGEPTDVAVTIEERK